MRYTHTHRACIITPPPAPYVYHTHTDSLTSQGFRCHLVLCRLYTQSSCLQLSVFSALQTAVVGVPVAVVPMETQLIRIKSLSIGICWWMGCKWEWYIKRRKLHWRSISWMNLIKVTVRVMWIFFTVSNNMEISGLQAAVQFLGKMSRSLILKSNVM